jgi:hypothetical protein
MYATVTTCVASTANRPRMAVASQPRAARTSKMPSPKENTCRRFLRGKHDCRGGLVVGKSIVGRYRHRGEVGDRGGSSERLEVDADRAESATRDGDGVVIGVRDAADEAGGPLWRAVRADADRDVEPERTTCTRAPGCKGAASSWCRACDRGCFLGK